MRRTRQRPTTICSGSSPKAHRVGSDVPLLNVTVHSSCYPMDLPQIQRQTDAEGLDYFEVPITFTEIGDE